MNPLMTTLAEILGWCTLFEIVKTGTKYDLAAVVLTAARRRTEETIARPANIFYDRIPTVVANRRTYGRTM